ncbi:MAG: site-specific integrase [Gammaproteobacteria bacterium]|nr:site-specific integrase [Gammaproteobacteria bacterium]
MASIRKRNGKYQARVTRQGWGTTAKTFTHRADAIRWARHTQILAEQGGIESATRCLTLGALIDRYRLSITPTKKNARTENLILKHWQQAPFADGPLNRIRPREIAAWRDQRLAEGRSSGTVRNYLATLSAVYRHAQTEWGLTAVANPVMMIRRPPPARARSRRVSESEIALIKSATESALLPDLIDTAVETAMRLSEMLSLTPRQIDLTSRTATLNDSKNGSSRVIPLSSRAIQILATRIEALDDLNQPLFPITSHAVTIAFRRAVSRAKQSPSGETFLMTPTSVLEDVRFHDLRREAISRFFEKGLDLMKVAAISGHKTSEMVQRYTRFVMPDVALQLC